MIQMHRFVLVQLLVHFILYRHIAFINHYAPHCSLVEVTLLALLAAHFHILVARHGARELLKVATHLVAEAGLAALTLLRLVARVEVVARLATRAALTLALLVRLVDLVVHLIEVARRAVALRATSRASRSESGRSGRSS